MLGPPQIEDIVGDTTYNTDDTMILTAQVSGYPAPEVTWYKDGVPLLESDDVKFESDPETGEYRLIVSNLAESGGGDYSIRATSPNWPDATDGVEVDVNPGGEARELVCTFVRLYCFQISMGVIDSH